MRAPCSGATLALIAVAVCWAVPSLPGQSPPRKAAPAFRIIELPSGRTLSVSREDLLGTPVLPGSVIKIATLVAALEAGVIRNDTRLLCPRHVEVGGREVTCSHADVGRPIGPAEALALSCNGYFASVAGRLRREALDGALVRLGLRPTSPAVQMVPAAIGLEGGRVSADRLLAAFVRVTSGSMRLGDDTRRVLVDGLRGAAEYGTASVLRERGISALAKTGTAAMPGGGTEGLLVAVTPADRPTRAIVVMVPGGAGYAAASAAADLLAASPPARSAPANGSPASVLPSWPDESRETIRVGIAKDGVGYDIQTMPLEAYVARVVGAEAAPSSGVEALKALAIVARTFALRNRPRHERDGFDVCSLTHCQVMGPRTKAGDQAAAATAGQVLFSADRPADVYYTASCGGHSERPSAVWPGAADPPYLPALPEPECRSNDAWQVDVSARDLQRALEASGRRGQVLRELTVLGRSSSGRVSRLRAEGFEPSQMSGEDFRRAVGQTLGWQMLKSTLFDIERTAAGYRFRGSGRGHGVGLCVVGSARMSADGRSAREILDRYFPGTGIRAADPGGSAFRQTRLEISLPATEERERPRVEDVSRTALREFSAGTGEPAPAAVQLVFHPTVEAYARASGKPWWTAAATWRTGVDFIPLSALRARGLVEKTIRHELAHVITSARLAGRPIWVREAVAMSLAAGERFADSSRPSPATPETSGSRRSTPLSCPTDAEWGTIRSAIALEDANRRAAACFAAQRGAGRRWDEIR
jgi:stage II sporulation protein D